MRRRVMCALLGWFFMAGYGQVTKHDFNDPIVCEKARLRVVAMLTPLGAATAKRVDLQCANDPSKPLTAEFTGTFRPEAPPK